MAKIKDCTYLKDGNLSRKPPRGFNYLTGKVELDNFNTKANIFLPRIEIKTN